MLYLNYAGMSLIPQKTFDVSLRRIVREQVQKQTGSGMQKMPDIPYCRQYGYQLEPGRRITGPCHHV